MDFIDALRVLARQWRVLLVGVMIIGAAGAAAIFIVPTKYQATGQLVLLLPPQATGTTTPTNPYLNLDPGLTITASLIASTLSTNDANRGLVADGYTSDYAIGLNPGSGPVLQISAEGTDGAMAVSTRDEVIRRLETELARIQLDENAPPRQLIHARSNSSPNVAEPLPGSKLRALAVLGGGGVVLTLLVAFVRDRRNVVPALSRTLAEVPGGRRPPAPDAPLSPPHRAEVTNPTNGSGRRRGQRQPVGGAPQSGWWDT